VERWVTGWFEQHLSDPEAGAPGAIVAIVQSGRVLLSRGYGVANIATGTPATPQTVFRAGSVSKPFTATAVMQLVEDGRVDASAPVNRYLRGWQVPVAFGHPVTVRELATHTAGFDARLERTAAPRDGDLRPLADYLRDDLPPQVRRSGQILAYSNHAYTLLGHLVEQVSGLPFERYMAEHVLGPLGMPRSSFRLTPDVEAHAATGYERSRRGFRPVATIHPRIYPAAGLNTTADDMARFMMAQLDGGRVGDARVLTPASVAEMQRQQFTQSPAMPGVTFGFFENVTRGERALVHGGGIRGFMSGLCLWPGYHLGLFVSNNGYSGRLVQEFFVAFVKRYFPNRDLPAREVPRRNGDRPLDSFEGAYRAAATTRTTFEKAGVLFADDVEIHAAGYWLPHLEWGGDWFVQTGALDFRLFRGDEPLAFREVDGRPSLLVTVTPLLGCEVFERVPWHETARWHRELFGLFVLSFLSVVLAPFCGRPIALVARWIAWPRPWPAAATLGWRWPRLLLFLVAALDLLFLALLAVSFRLASGTGVLYGVPPLARWELALAAATSLLALALPAAGWYVWRRTDWPLPARVHYTFCVAAALAFIPFLRYWNLLAY
jgi:CubicO group peptidase (beta-lactamase class C family)